MAYRLAEAFVEIRAQKTQLDRDIKGVQSSLSNKFAEIGKIAGGMLAANLITRVGQLFSGLGETTLAFEQNMARVQALTQTTGAAFASLGAQAEDLGRTTQFTAAQAAMAMGNLAQSGFSVNEIMTAIPNTLNLAAAGQVDLATAADITAKVMRGMGMSAEELTNTVDVMTKAMVTSNTDLVQLGEAMKFVGPVARSSGKGITEVVSAIQVMSNAGIQASMAGTSLRNILTRLSGGTSEADAVFKTLGLTMQTSEGQMKPLATIIDELRDALSGLNESEQVAMLMKAFGQRAGPAMAAMIAEGGDALREYQALLDDAGGTAQEIAETQMATLMGAFKRLRSAIEGAAITLSKPMFAPVAATVDLFSNILTASNSAVVRFTASIVAGAAAIKTINLAIRAYTMMQRAAAAATSFTLALAGPKGWAQLAAGVAVAVGTLASLDAAFGSVGASADEAVEKAEAVPGAIQETTSALSDLAKASEELGVLADRFTRFGNVFRDAMVTPEMDFSADDILREVDEIEAKLAQLELAGADIGDTGRARAIADRLKQEAEPFIRALNVLQSIERQGGMSSEEVAEARNKEFERFNALVREGADILDELGVETGLAATVDDLKRANEILKDFGIRVGDPREQFDEFMKELSALTRSGALTQTEAAEIRVKARLELDEELGGAMAFIQDLEEELAGLGKTEDERILERLLGNPDVTKDQIREIQGLLDQIAEKEKELELADLGESIFESTRTAAEQFEEEKQKLIEVFQAGLLPGGDETFMRHLSALQERFLTEPEPAAGRTPFQGGLQEFARNIQGGLQTDDQMKKYSESTAKNTEMAAKTLAEIKDQMGQGGSLVATVGEG